MATNRKDVPKHYYTLEEYFALEHAGNARFEYWDGDIVCMSGGSKNHYWLSRNIFSSLDSQLKGRDCVTFSAEVPIKTATLPPYRYPDVSVVCGEPGFENINGIDALLNPTLIIEVMSPSTATLDQRDKFKAYQAIGAFTEYLLISQDSTQVIHLKRGSDTDWSRNEITDPNGSLNLDSIDCYLSLREIYLNVVFE
jgi:Uma2 family endonuclease